MDKYFKILRAREEIARLNIEIRRVITHLRDEEQFLLHKENEQKPVNAVLAHQIHLYRLERLRFAEIHIRRFKKLEATPGFTGTLTCGTAISDGLKIDMASAAASSMSRINIDPMPDDPILDAESQEAEVEAEQDVAEEEDFAAMFDTLLAISY